MTSYIKVTDTGNLEVLSADVAKNNCTITVKDKYFFYVEGERKDVEAFVRTIFSERNWAKIIKHCVKDR